jgi:hypothetical protein
LDPKFKKIENKRRKGKLRLGFALESLILRLVQNLGSLPMLLELRKT